MLDAPHIELDAIFHQPGWTELDDEEFRSRVDRATEAPRWVVDGNYSAVQPIVWTKADTVAWFDLPRATVLARTVRRTVRRVLTREELWNGNREPFSNLWSLDPHTSIIAWAATQHGRYRARYQAAERDPEWARLRFVRLRAPSDADALLSALASESVRGE